MDVKSAKETVEKFKHLEQVICDPNLKTREDMISDKFLITKAFLMGWNQAIAECVWIAQKKRQDHTGYAGDYDHGAHRASNGIAMEILKLSEGTTKGEK